MIIICFWLQTRQNTHTHTHTTDTANIFTFIISAFSSQRRRWNSLARFLCQGLDGCLTQHASVMKYKNADIYISRMFFSPPKWDFIFRLKASPGSITISLIISFKRKNSPLCCYPCQMKKNPPSMMLLCDYFLQTVTFQQSLSWYSSELFPRQSFSRKWKGIWEIYNAPCEFLAILDHNHPSLSLPWSCQD